MFIKYIQSINIVSVFVSDRVNSVSLIVIKIAV